MTLDAHRHPGRSQIPRVLEDSKRGHGGSGRPRVALPWCVWYMPAYVCRLGIISAVYLLSSLSYVPLMSDSNPHLITHSSSGDQKGLLYY
jgi:hypothetical protein